MIARVIIIVHVMLIAANQINKKWCYCETFLINAKQSDTNKIIVIQLVDELTLVDFTDVTTAILYYGSNYTDITDAMNRDDSSFAIPLNEEMSSSIGDLRCEIV